MKPELIGIYIGMVLNLIVWGLPNAILSGAIALIIVLALRTLCLRNV